MTPDCDGSFTTRAPPVLCQGTALLLPSTPRDTILEAILISFFTTFYSTIYHQTGTDSHVLIPRMQTYPAPSNYDAALLDLAARSASNFNNDIMSIDAATAFNQKALQQGADQMVKLAYQDPAWLALQGLLPASAASSSASAPSAPSESPSLPAVGTAPFHDENLRPSPFESPLAVSSIGSPNSSRDFGDSPLMRADDDYILGGDHASTYAAMPLFGNFVSAASIADTPTSDVKAAAPSDLIASNGPWAQDSSFVDFVSAAREAFYGQARATEAPLPQTFNLDFGDAPFESAGHVAPTDVNPVVKNEDGRDGANYHYGPFVGGLSHGQADFTSTVRRLSLSESVSGYSSSQDSGVNSMNNSMLGLPNNLSSAATPSISSSDASPAASGASFNAGPESISQLAGVFVREYARCRDEQDTSVLVRALNVAGIQVDAATLNNIMLSPSAGQSSPVSPFDGTAVEQQQHDVSFEQQMPAAFEPVQPLASVANHQRQPHESPKVRSSAHGAVKKSALGHRHTHSHGKVTPPQGFWVDGKRLYQCDVCQKTFDRAFNLKTHQTIHSVHREYPFTCPFDGCGKAFSRKADCNRHTKSVHLKKGEKLQPGQALAVVDLG